MTEWKRDDCLRLLLCLNLEESRLLLYIQSSHSFTYSEYSVDTVHSHDCALLLIHPFQQFIFLEKKKKDVCMKDYGNKYIFEE